MDSHHVAQYGLIAVLAAGGGAGYYALSSRPLVVNASHVARAVWPPLSDAQFVTLRAALVPVTRGRTFIVYCVNPNCADVADDVARALKAAGGVVAVETPLNAADGLEVGSDDPEEAARLSDALKTASLKPSMGRPHHGETYISFGSRLD